MTGARNITTIVKSLFSNSCLFQADGYCIDALWGMFSYIEKPFTLVDIIAEEVVVISDGVNDDCTNYENPTLCFITCSLIGRILESHLE